MDRLKSLINPPTAICGGGVDSKACYHDKICSVSRKEALLSRYGTYLINVGFVSYENKAETTLQRINEIMNITT